MMKKKSLLALAVICTMGLSSLAFAEAEEGQDEIMQELQAPDTQTAAGASAELVGEEILQNEIRTVPDVCMIGVMSAEFMDQVQAVDAAEDSVKIKASAGNICLDVKIVYRHGKTDAVIEPLFTCGINVGGDTDYKGRLMIEAEHNDGTAAYHKNDPSCNSNCYKYYLVNVENSLISASADYYNDTPYCYYLYDYVVQIPQEYATDATPIYVQIMAGETQFYYQVK